MDPPETRYVKTSDGLYIAYQLLGAGALDITWMPGFVSGNVEVVWEQPLVSLFLHRLASIGRLIIHDRRGTGLSDRASRLPDLETRAADLLEVLDAAGARRAVLMGGSEGGAPCALLAATRPERVASLVWWNAMPRSRWAPDFPWGETQEQERSWLRDVEQGWGTDAFASAYVAREAPSLRGDPGFIRWLARMQRHLVTPGSAVELARIWYETDVRHVLPLIGVPTLIIGRDGRTPEPGQYTASRIRATERIVLAGEDAPPYAGDQGALISAITRFLGVFRPPPEVDRVLATVLFTDIVGSTKRASELGDSAWRGLLRLHHSAVRTQLQTYQGREIDTAGDGVFATFDGPARAVRCAQAIIEAVRPLGLEIRAGVHVGEVLTLETKVAGIAVNIGARIGGIAGPGQIFVSSTVRDLVAGSGLVFEDAGEHELKGVPDRWRLYRVLSASA